jgi:hypothetical protein
MSIGFQSPVGLAGNAAATPPVSRRQSMVRTSYLHSFTMAFLDWRRRALCESVNRVAHSFCEIRYGVFGTQNWLRRRQGRKLIKRDSVFACGLIHVR